MKFLSGFFRWQKCKPEPVALPSRADLEFVDTSHNKLKEAALQVKEAAAAAAKTLQERLEESEHRFASTMDAIDDLVVIKNGMGQWIKLNRAGEKVFGITKPDYYGLTNEQIGQRNPKLYTIMKDCTKSDECAWRTWKPYREEEDIFGRVFDIEKTPTFDAHGNRCELIVVGRDITEKIEEYRRSKACFTALNSASDPIVIADKNMNVYFTNDRFNSMVGEIKTGDNLLSILSADMEVRKLIWSTIVDNIHWVGELEITVGGKYLISIMPVMNGVPDPIFYICSLKGV